MSLSAVLFGQHMHPTLVVVAFILEQKQKQQQRHPLMLHLCSWKCQELFVNSVLKLFFEKQCRVAAPFAYVAQIAKVYTRMVEELRMMKLQQPPKQNSDGEQEDEEEEEEEDDPLSDWHDDLVELASNGGKMTKWDRTVAAGAGARACDENLTQLLFFDGENKLRFAVGPQFENVGLSLWPAAAVLTEMLSMEVAERAGKEERMNGRLVVVELGAGIGVTGVVFERRALAVSNINGNKFSFTMTDYQQQIVDLGQRNLDLNRDDATTVVSQYALLDWTESERNTIFFRDHVWKNNHGAEGLIIAADVIYDRTVLDGLASTIKIAFDEAAKAGVGQARCVIIHTLRVPETLEEFRAELKSRGLKLTVSPIATSCCGEVSAALNAGLQQAVDVLRTMQDDTEVLFAPFWSSKENVLRSLQGGQFFGDLGLFAKMAANLLRLDITCE